MLLHNTSVRAPCTQQCARCNFLGFRHVAFAQHVGKSTLQCAGCNFLGFRHVAFAQHVGKSTLHTAVCKAAIGYGFCSLPELIPSILSATPDRGRAETWLLGFDLARTPSQGSEMTPARFIGAYGVFLLGKRGATRLQLLHAILASHE